MRFVVAHFPDKHHRDLTAAIGRFIDIEVQARTAVETLQVNEQAFYRLIPAEGNVLPVKIVGTNLSAEEIAFGREVLK